MKIIEEKQNQFLKRKEIKVIMEAEKNPTIQEATKIVAEQFKAEEENIIVRQVKGKFGRNTFLISANIYNNKEAKEQIEPKKKEKKGKTGEEKKEEKPAEKPAPVAEQPTETREEPKPAEEQKEEKPEETKEESKEQAGEAKEGDKEASE